MRTLSIAILLAAVAGLVVPAWAEKKNEGNNPIQEMYCRYLKVKASQVKGAKGLIWKICMTMKPVNGGKDIDFWLPMVNGQTGKPIEWDDANKKRFADMKVGSIYHVAYNIQNGSMYVCQAFEPYESLPGEDEPNVFLFVQETKDKAGWPGVKVSKFKAEYTLALPAGKGPGKPTPDAKMVELLKQAKANDLLEIEATGPEKAMVIKTLKFWEPPLIGEVGSITSKNDKGFATVEINDATKSTVAWIPKNKSNLLSVLRPLASEKAKSRSVLYRVREDEKDSTILWLTDARPTPDNYVAPAIASKDPKKGPAVPTGSEKDGVFLSAGKTKAPISGEEIDFVEIQTPGPEEGMIMKQKYLVSQKESATVIGKVKDFKPGTEVTFWFTNDNQGKWMSDIKLKAAKPVEKKPADEPKKLPDNNG